MLVLYFEVSVAAVFCIYILYQPYKRQNTNGITYDSMVSGISST